MRFVLLFILPLFTCFASETPVIEEPTNLVKKMDILIKATEDSLARQKEIRKLLVAYKETEAKAITNPDSSQTLLTLVSQAAALDTLIKESYLEDYFPEQFLSELQKLKEIADKKNLPQAK